MDDQNYTEHGNTGTDASEQIFPPVSSAAASRSVVLTGLAVAFSLFGDMTMYTVLPVHFPALGLSPFQVGIVLSANRWVRLVTNHVAERAIRRASLLGLTAGALVVGAGLAFLYGLAPPFPALLVARLGWGLCWSVLRHVGVMNAVDVGERRRVGRLVGLYNAMVPLGHVAGTALGGLFFDMLGYRSAFHLMAGLSLIGLVPAVLGLSRRNVTPPPRIAAPSPSLRSGARTYAMGFIVGSVGSGLIMATLGHVLTARFSGSVTVAGYVLGTATLTGLLLSLRHVFLIGGSPFLGTLLDRWGPQRAAPAFFVGATLALTAAALRLPPAALLASVAVFFICETALRIGLTVEAGRNGSRQYARLATAMDVGAAAGPLVGWTALGVVMETGVTFGIGAALYATGAVMLLTFRRGENRRTHR